LTNLQKQALLIVYNELDVPRTRLVCSERPFAVHAAPKAWIRLAVDIKSTHDTGLSKKHLKTFFIPDLRPRVLRMLQASGRLCHLLFLPICM